MSTKKLVITLKSARHTIEAVRSTKRTARPQVWLASEACDVRLQKLMARPAASSASKRVLPAWLPGWLNRLLDSEPWHLQKLNKYTERLIYDAGMKRVWSQFSAKGFSDTQLAAFFNIVFSALTVLPEAEQAGNPSPELKSHYAKISKLAGELADLIGPIYPLTPEQKQNSCLKRESPDGTRKVIHLTLVPFTSIWHAFQDSPDLSEDIYEQLRKLERAAEHVSEEFQEGGLWDREVKRLAHHALPFSRKASAGDAALSTFVFEASWALRSPSSKERYDELIAELASVIFDTPIVAESVRKIRERKIS